MDYHRLFNRTRRSDVQAAQGAEHAGGAWTVRHSRLPFMARWVLALSSAMLLAGLADYGLGHQQIVDRALQDSLLSYGALASGVEEVLAAESDPTIRSEAIADEIRHLGLSYGTVYVGLFDAQNRLIASTADGRAGVDDSHHVDPGRLAEVLSTGQATVEMEADEGEESDGRYEFILPVSSPEGAFILEIDQRADIVTGLVNDLRLRKVLGLLMAVLIAIPLSYFFGGRTLHRRQLRAQREADVDALTNLPGRRPFKPTLEAALTHRKEATVTLALVDLDGFKQVNDRLGHSHGDRVLGGLADSFTELRASDTAFRLGGDEFAIILPGSDEDQTVEALERVRSALVGRFVGVTFSAGIASSTVADPAALQELWERADAALYEAKRRGRRQSVTFTAMATGHTVSGEKIDALTALVAGDTPISVAFQPIWDLRRGVVLAHEALLRLPAGSPISGPHEAFELAERLGLAAALDARARDTVLTWVRKRRWEGLLFLNVHPDALAHLDIEALISSLTAVGLEPADVVLEVTEQAGLDHPEPIRTLARAHGAGFRLALDDMGRSNAGLRALTLVRFDIIKIDGEVVSRLGTDPSSAAIVAAAMTFVRRTGGWVVAEGIEEDRMLTALLQPGNVMVGGEPVLAGQGYLLGRPAQQPVGLDTHLPVLDQHPFRTETDGRDTGTQTHTGLSGW
ncbi:EAL domain-containing protein [Arthrobacter sp. TMN-50]